MHSSMVTDNGTFAELGLSLARLAASCACGNLRIGCRGKGHAGAVRAQVSYGWSCTPQEYPGGYRGPGPRGLRMREAKTACWCTLRVQLQPHPPVIAGPAHKQCFMSTRSELCTELRSALPRGCCGAAHPLPQSCAQGAGEMHSTCRRRAHARARRTPGGVPLNEIPAGALLSARAESATRTDRCDD